MKKVVYALAILVTTFTVDAQSKKEKDAKAIKKMCGCFEVNFNFEYTFQY